jgi:hypothetical protein
MKKLWIVLAFLMLNKLITAQPERWQQRISYDINVTMNVTTNVMNGTEKIVYFNNSPDTLNRIFFHTYWNAFQPNSSMDVKSREQGKIVIGTDKQGKEVRDWDARVKDRVLMLISCTKDAIDLSSISINKQDDKVEITSTQKSTKTLSRRYL